jgi:DNA replication protein DnaC
MGAIDHLLFKISNTTSERRKIRAGDYQKDGLWYCGNCNTPKQAEVTIAGTTVKPMCLCKCQQAADKEKEREDRTAANREMCFDDPSDTLSTFALDDGKNEITKTCKAYADNFAELLKQNKGLVLFGETGVGKTFAVNALANELIDRGYKVRSTSLRSLGKELQGFNVDRSRVIRSLNLFDLLILDDWGTERDTEWMNELVQEIIDSRYKANKPLILTTNYGAQELKTPADLKMKRIVSRLYDICVFIEVKGKDRRRATLIADNEKIKNLLGVKE